MRQASVKFYDFSNHFSLSKVIKSIILPKSNTDGLVPRLRLGRRNIEETKTPLSFMALVGFHCCLQFIKKYKDYEKNVYLF